MYDVHPRTYMFVVYSHARIQTPAVRTSDWVTFPETADSGVETKISPAGHGPIEQLNLTGGQAGVQGYFTDYLWYSTTVDKSEDGQ